jgi:hypothetical protein
MLKKAIKEVLYLGYVKDERVVISFNKNETKDLNFYIDMPIPEAHGYLIIENLLNEQLFYVSFFELQKFINEATII